MFACPPISHRDMINKMGFMKGRPSSTMVARKPVRGNLSVNRGRYSSSRLASEVSHAPLVHDIASERHAPGTKATVKRTMRGDPLRARRPQD